MTSKIGFGEMFAFARTMQAVRENFPKFAREIDRCIFDVGANHIEKCQRPNCFCQMDFETFRDEQNLKFGTTAAEIKSDVAH